MIGSSANDDGNGIDAAKDSAKVGMHFGTYGVVEQWQAAGGGEYSVHEEAGEGVRHVAVTLIRQLPVLWRGVLTPAEAGFGRFGMRESPVLRLGLPYGARLSGLVMEAATSFPGLCRGYHLSPATRAMFK